MYNQGGAFDANFHLEYFIFAGQVTCITDNYKTRVNIH